MNFQYIPMNIFKKDFFFFEKYSLGAIVSKICFPNIQILIKDPDDINLKNKHFFSLFK